MFYLKIMHNDKIYVRMDALKQIWFKYKEYQTLSGWSLRIISIN
jgi:hypothetical protein